jgi:YD repeat-containing protein
MRKPWVEDGPRTDVQDLTTYAYYPEDATCTGSPLGCRGQLQQVTNSLGHATRFGNYTASGAPGTLTDPNGLVTSLAYDARQRLTSMSVGGEQTRYAYDRAGQLTRITLANGAYLDYSYDNAHRLIQVKDHLGNTRKYTLDNMGNRTKEELSDANGQLARSQSRVYDALSRLQNLILPQ